MSEFKLDRNRKRVRNCPCGKSNKDGKFSPFRDYEKFGYCHSCCETFFPDSEKKIEPIYKDPLPASSMNYNLVINSGQAFEKNNFVIWLKKWFGSSKTDELIKQYSIGTSTHWNGANVFWQIDNLNVVRGGKIMLYNASNGKRIKNPYNHINWVHSVLKTPHYNLKQCLFAEHLTSIDKHKTIAITEAEKTSVFMAGMHPNYIWLATGCKGNFKYDLLRKLYGRKILAYPDKGEFNNWLDVANELSDKYGFDITIDSTIENSELPDGSDLVDYYEAGNTLFKPIRTQAEQMVDALHKKNPAINNLIDTFDLTDELGFTIRTY